MSGPTRRPRPREKDDGGPHHVSEFLPSVLRGIRPGDERLEAIARALGRSARTTAPSSSTGRAA